MIEVRQGLLHTGAMTMLSFEKLHGLGNDFVLVDFVTGDPGASESALTKEVIQAIADRKRGVGFDQLLVLAESARLQARLHIYNADGSKAEMCGNGLRAAALHLWRVKPSLPPQLVFQTDAGDRSAQLLGPVDGGLIETEMGAPRFPKAHKSIGTGFTLAPLRGRVKPVLVNVGNPHAVFFVRLPVGKGAVTPWVARHGAVIEIHKAFPRRTNVEFAQVLSRHQVRAFVWERGVGLTEACGTGAVAVACAAIREGLCESPVEVLFPGGAVEVRWDGEGSAFLRGHAAHAFSAQWPL